jgi:uncharacterized SAM-binding protein YcdF (DUF218 family)
MQDLFFYLSKSTWLLIKPDSLFLFALTLTGILWWRGYDRLARRLLVFLILMAWIVYIVPVGGWLKTPLDTRFETNPGLPERIDGVIVLGGSVITRASSYWQQLETNDYADRIIHFITLAQRYPTAKLVFTGGNASISGSGSTEAEHVRDLFKTRGIKNERIIIEDQSRNTAENAVYSKRLARPQPGENWILITSSTHMPRSVGLFCKQNWPVIPYPVDHGSVPDGEFNPSPNLVHNVETLNQAVYEWIGLTAYYFSGKIDQWLPSGCRGDRHFQSN